MSYPLYGLFHPPGRRPCHSVRVIVPPTCVSVFLSEVKTHCRVEHDADDLLLRNMVTTALDLVEREANFKLAAQTVEITFDDFPCGAEPLALPVWPVQTVGSVTYKQAGDGADTPLSGFQTWVAHDPPLVAPPAGSGWPAVQCGAIAPVTVTCVCGLDANVWPGMVAVQAVHLTVGYWYGFRGDGKDPNKDQSIPGEAGLPAGAVRLLGLIRRSSYR